MTVTIQIGNSDNKLTQAEWAAFCTAVGRAVLTRTPETHFCGQSPGDAPWQNAAWVVEIKELPLAYLCEDLQLLAAKYRQDSIALTVGATEFLRPAPSE